MTREKTLEELGRVDISQRMIPGVPSPIAGVQTPHCGDLIIDHTQLFVMGEVVHQLAFVFSAKLYL